ncbi:hypothetical protein C8R43DRAFT_1195090 [Mycena crocata]|nr:hypothetical protein C8R43DRAFT_1195090 [Mycena crocata]
MLCDSCKIPLFSHTLPTPAESSALRNFLRTTALAPDPSRYPQYDTEKALQGLRGDRLKLQDYADGFQAAVAPIRLLPPEILGEIFAPLSIPAKDGEAVESIAKFDLLRLSRVCSHWHKLIMGTPKLWSNITVDLFRLPRSGGVPSLYFDLLNASLERGVSHPPTLSVANSTFSRDTFQAIFPLLAQHSHRWKHLDLWIDQLSELRCISHLEKKFDSLETLSLRCSRLCFYTGFGVFETASRLTKVSFGAPDPRCCPPFPWHQLRSFACDAGNTADVAALLGLMRNVSHPDAAFETLHRTIQLLGQALDCLTLPRLRELSLNSTSSQRPIPWPLHAFTALDLRSSFCNMLRSLDIRYVAVTQDDLIHSLASLVSLTQLVISDQLDEISGITEILVTDALLRRLALTSDSDSCLVPQLEFLDCTSLFQFSADAYLDFAMSRVTHGTTWFQGILRDFSGRSCRFEVANHQPLLDFARKHTACAVLETDAA